VLHSTPPSLFSDPVGYQKQVNDPSAKQSIGKTYEWEMISCSCKEKRDSAGLTVLQSLKLKGTLSTLL